jgi:ectoine hydroxylase-related dioxygenase (phytanoyl-CoA dioxygenase family)
MVQDLSTIHHPSTDLFRWPEDKRGWAKYRLSGDQLDFFENNGYIAGIDMLDDVQVDVLREQLSDLANPAYPGNELFYEYHSNESADPATVLFHALGAWRIKPAFHDVLWNPAFLMPAAQLLGGPVRFWHDQLFCKPAHHGGVVAWHQDYSYWTRTQPMSHLTCWIALDDSTRDNGCLYYVPGSHRWNLLPVTGLTGNMDEIKTVLSPEQIDAFHPVPIELRKGQASFHHPLLVHGSYENRTDRQRRATLVNVFRDGVRSASNEVLLHGVPPIPKGEMMSGQFFPLLFDSADLPG